MDSKESLHREIRAMASRCAVCECDARDVEKVRAVSLDLGEIAHPEDAFDIDLLWHRRERHRETLLRKIQAWLGPGSG
jgi:hypothetical protein